MQVGRIAGEGHQRRATDGLHSSGSSLDESDGEYQDYRNHERFKKSRRRENSGRNLQDQFGEGTR